MQNILERCKQGIEMEVGKMLNHWEETLSQLHNKIKINHKESFEKIKDKQAGAQLGKIR